MKILGLDSATTACSAAISIDGNAITHRHQAMTRGQSEAMIPMVETVFAEAELEAKDLDLIVVSVGPGAFTGLRIAIATALGLSLASGVDAAGVSTMDVLAYGARLAMAEPTDAIVALGSRRDDVYLQVFSATGQAVNPVEAVAPDGLPDWATAVSISAPTLVVGDATERVFEAFAAKNLPVTVSGASGVPDAVLVAALAVEKISKGQSLLPTKPLYLRPPDAVVPKNGGRLRA